MNWKLIDDEAKTGHEVLLGSVASPEMDFYRWNDVCGEWLDRCGDPPRETPTHYMVIEPPRGAILSGVTA